MSVDQRSFPSCGFDHDQARELAFERDLEALTRQCGSRPPEQFQLMCEDLRLQFHFPGQYVAYQDIWHNQDGAPILERKVILSDADACRMTQLLHDRLRELAISESEVEQQFIDPDVGISDRQVVGV